MENTALKRTIMRRVYYSYALSFATHAMLWRGVLLGAALMLLADWLHVASIVQNFLNTPVGSTPQYVFNAFLKAAANGELLTVLTVLLFIGIGASTTYELARRYVLPRLFVSVYGA